MALKRFIRSLKSRTLFKIDESKGIYILETDLGEVMGYYTRVRRIKLIVLNRNLCSHKHRFTCAHELGRALLHPDEKAPRLSTLSLTSKLKIEQEANEFATHLLIDDSHKEYSIETVGGVLKYYGLPTGMERFIHKEVNINV